MADHKIIPVFAYSSEIPQLSDIRVYLNKLGASLDPDGSEKVLENLLEVISNLEYLIVCSTGDCDNVLNSVLSLIVTIGAAEVGTVVTAICNSLVPAKSWEARAANVVRLLSKMFQAFHLLPSVQRTIYKQLVLISGNCNLIEDIDCRPDTLEDYFKKWQSPVEEKREILRLIHASLLKDSRVDQAAKIMLVLLGTYTAEDANIASEDAAECVRIAIVDPKSFSFDAVENLSAVEALKKSDPLMHEALHIFISETLKEYKEFTKKHPTFVEERLKVNESILLNKIRLLTILTMAEKSDRLSYKDLSERLEFPDSDELEEFLIKALRTDAISGKVDEMAKELRITSYEKRRFCKEDWLTLQSRLNAIIASMERNQKITAGKDNILDDDLPCRFK